MAACWERSWQTLSWSSTAWWFLMRSMREVWTRWEWYNSWLNNLLKSLIYCFSLGLLSHTILLNSVCPSCRTSCWACWKTNFCKPEGSLQAAKSLQRLWWCRPHWRRISFLSFWETVRSSPFLGACFLCRRCSAILLGPKTRRAPSMWRRWDINKTCYEAAGCRI